MTLQEAPMAGRMGYDKMLEWTMAQFYSRAFGEECVGGAHPAPNASKLTLHQLPQSP